MRVWAGVQRERAAYRAANYALVAQERLDAEDVMTRVRCRIKGDSAGAEAALVAWRM